MKEADYRNYFKKRELIDKADKWLAANPPPAGWRAGRYAWAYTEMPLWPWEKFKVKKVRNGRA